MDQTHRLFPADYEAIKKNFVGIWQKYGETHTITARLGLKVDLRKLAPNESVCYGDGETFHFLLTKK